MLSQAEVVKIRKQIEPWYTDTLRVYGLHNVEEDGITHEEMGLIMEVPCFMTFIFGERETKAENHAPVLNQKVKIFTKPEYEIPAGCDLEIDKYGRLLKYTMSGMPAFYPTHQEIVCTVKDDYANY